MSCSRVMRVVRGSNGESARIQLLWKQIKRQINSEGSVRLDDPPAYDPVSQQGMKTHALSIPTSLSRGFPFLLEENPIPVGLTVGKP